MTEKVEGSQAAETATTPEPEAPPQASIADALDIEYPDKPEGPISAAIIAGGIGCLAMGVVTTIAEIGTVKEAFNWYDPVGPLSGKSIVAVIVWLVAWVVLHYFYRGRPYDTTKAFRIALVLIGLGVIMTFPVFFQLFASE